MYVYIYLYIHAHIYIYIYLGGEGRIADLGTWRAQEGTYIYIYISAAVAVVVVVVVVVVVLVEVEEVVVVSRVNPDPPENKTRRNTIFPGNNCVRLLHETRIARVKLRYRCSAAIR